MKSPSIVLTAVAFLVSSCATDKQGHGGTAQTAMLVGGIAVMAAASPLVPVTSAIARASRPDRALMFPEVFRLPDGRFIVSNYLGWFTDRSEMPAPGKGWRADSAWVIDLATSPRDDRNRILLSEENLSRWYFRETDRKSLQEIPEKSPESGEEYFDFEFGAASLDLHLKNQPPVTLFLKQK